MKKIKVVCEHINWDNERDCKKEAKYACRCCSSPVCEEHLEKRCGYGGELFYELEEDK
jgi:hypothetical protein